ncbi:hypothetical protein MTR_1g069475 [Medicago truncatula]|uniref:RNase H type-1 domain-containing protein n=1 Tax=Medicago truncatula TaxID=3880 RepID=A0A072VKY6_MEDTR|nr:hypothetical protein MTR_1g069475 [Medicago truncatula]
MSLFLLPSTLIDSTGKMLNGFWWGNGGGSNRGIHRLYWDKLTVHKTKGGMGFRDLTAFNLAMLGKPGWKLQNYLKLAISLVMIILMRRSVTCSSSVVCNGTLEFVDKPQFTVMAECYGNSPGHIGAREAAVENSTVEPMQARWQKPVHVRLKCNVDALFSDALNCVGFGFCIRDEAGNFIRAKTMWSNPVCSTDVGEALGLSHAIRWVHELQLTNVDFEFDAKKVVDYFNRGSNDITEFGAIVGGVSEKL